MRGKVINFAALLLSVIYKRQILH